MKEILIFAGTTEGRELSEYLAVAGIAHTICVATEYGEIVLKEHPLAKVHKGRMNQEEMKSYIEAGGYEAVVDATHPYAEVVTQNIRNAMQDMDILYLRLKRENDVTSTYEKIQYFKDSVSCAKALKKTDGNILLTTGSKELPVFTQFISNKERLYVRVLPGIESLQLCMDCGIAGKQILALQGPFTTQMNEAMLRQYQIKCLVTKESGNAGGYQEKLDAAQNLGIPVFVIGCPVEQESYTFEEVCEQLEMIFGQRIKKNTGFQITLAGVGMGNSQCLTKEVEKAIAEADILLGADRMIAGYQPKIEKMPYYTPEQIVPYLDGLSKVTSCRNDRNVVILFSGDTGFYSGCQKLYEALLREIKHGRLQAMVTVMPGISSVAYLAACMGENYQDAVICSMHGKELPNLAKKIRMGKKIFLLMSGLKDIHKLGKLLLDAGLIECTVVAGYQLSYPEQLIMELKPEECMKLQEDGLYTCCIKNPKPERKMLTHGKADGEFIRDNVPMTKEEVREVSICKLKLYEGAVVYDIGSGTGSIAVEIAGLSNEIKVFAVEYKEEAVSLIAQNKEKFELNNIEIVSGKAPDGLEELPVPTHAFIGGSGGRMKEILSVLYQKNSQMRVVINSISMETICEIKEVLSTFSIQNADVVQMQVSRAKSVGAYHLMQAENPVWICSFDFSG
ncbi:MAG: precorrin-6A reductase [Eubacterium sp.]|nr:precorrin-6A reductase [Lachnospiraceae bacterium]MBO5486158.1 precorrin-6A reductase [Eubacterium sp.]